MIEFQNEYLLLLLVLPILCFFILPPIKNGIGQALSVPFIDDLKMIKNKADRLYLPNISKGVLFSLKFSSFDVIFI